MPTVSHHTQAVENGDIGQLDSHLADSDSDTLKVDSTNDDSSSEVSSTKPTPVRNGRKFKSLSKQ